LDKGDAAEHTIVGPYSYEELVQQRHWGMMYMGMRKALTPGEFVLSLRCVVIYVKFDKALGGLRYMDNRATINTMDCWIATEIDVDTLALGFFCQDSLLIYKNGKEIKYVATPYESGLYGIITPPITTDPSVGMANPLLLCLDNESCALADLRDEEPVAKELFRLKTGIGGFMPRYLARASSESSFSVLIIQLHSPMSTVAEYNLLSYRFKLTEQEETPIDTTPSLVEPESEKA
jgi:hypothetical protein